MIRYRQNFVLYNVHTCVVCTCASVCVHVSMCPCICLCIYVTRFARRGLRHTPLQLTDSTTILRIHYVCMYCGQQFTLRLLSETCQMSMNARAVFIQWTLLVVKQRLPGYKDLKWQAIQLAIQHQLNYFA